MAEPKNTMPLNLANYGYLPNYKFDPPSAEPPISEGQMKWGLSQIMPGMGIADTGGLVPGPPSYDQPPEEYQSGEPMASAAENIERGGLGYLDAGLQGLGALADVAMAAPVFALPLKAISTGGKMLRAGAIAAEAATNKALKGGLGSLEITPTKSNVQFTKERAGENPPVPASSSETYRSLESKPRSRTIETVSERAAATNQNYGSLTRKYPVTDFINDTVRQAPKAARGNLERQFNEWLPASFRAGKATRQEILDELGKNKPTINEHIEIDTPPLRRGEPEMSIQRYSEHMPYIPDDTVEMYSQKIFNKDGTQTTVQIPTNGIDALQTIHPTRYGTNTFAISGGKYGDKTLFKASDFQPPGAGSHERLGGEYAENTRELFSTSGNFNDKNRIFHQRWGIYDIGEERIYIPAETQSDAYLLGGSLSAGKNIIKNSGGAKWTEKKLNELVSQRIWSGDDTVSDTPSLVNWVQELKKQDPGANWQKTSDEFATEINEAGYTLAKNGYLPRHDTYKTRMGDVAMKYKEKYAEAMVLDNPSATPMVNDYFSTSVKLSLSNATSENATKVRFPMNGYALAKVRGEGDSSGLNFQPPRAAEYREDFDLNLYAPEEFEDIRHEVGNSPMRFTPTPKANNMGEIYKRETNNALEQIEAEYGVKLNPETITDSNKNEWLEVTLTPELKKEFERLLLNRGGAVYKKPLMNLRY